MPLLIFKHHFLTTPVASTHPSTPGGPAEGWSLAHPAQVYLPHHDLEFCSTKIVTVNCVIVCSALVIGRRRFDCQSSFLRVHLPIQKRSILSVRVQFVQIRKSHWLATAGGCGDNDSKPSSKQSGSRKSPQHAAARSSRRQPPHAAASKRRSTPQHAAAARSSRTQQQPICSISKITLKIPVQSWIPVQLKVEFYLSIPVQIS